METFGWKFFAKLTSCFCLNIERKTFGWLSEKSPRGFYAAFYVSMGTLWRKYFWKVLHLLWTFFQINSGNWAGKVWPACQNCIHRIYEIILKKKLFWKTNEILHHFQTLSRKFSASIPVFRRGCWNCNLRVQGNILTKNSFISIFFQFWTLSNFFDQFSQKTSRAVKTGFSVSMETFGCKSFAKPTHCYFLEFRAEIFRLAVRKKSAWLSSCFLPLHGNNLKELFLKSFCIFCGPFCRSFPIIEQEKFGRPVKTAFIVSIKSFWKKLS